MTHGEQVERTIKDALHYYRESDNAAGVWQEGLRLKAATVDVLERIADALEKRNL